jgi:hypothetical protein
MALQGTLEDLPLVDLIQVLALQNRTGILSLNCDFSQGQLCFNKAKLFSAYVRHQQPGGIRALEGEEAVFDLLSWANGYFSFEAVAALPSQNNVHKNWDYLILESCRRQDEQKNQRKLAGAAHIVPKLIPNPPNQASISLKHSEWKLLMRVNGRDTFAEIAQDLRLPLEQIIEIGYELQKINLLEFLNRQLPAAAPVPVPVMAAPVAATPLMGWTGEVFSQMTPALAGGMPVAANGAGYYQSRPLAPQKSVVVEKPKVQRSLISSLIAKIRGL